jgi:hypothetical protein
MWSNSSNPLIEPTWTTVALMISVSISMSIYVPVYISM